MIEKYTNFAHLLIEEIDKVDEGWSISDSNNEVISINNEKKQLINLNLTPFDAVLCSDVAEHYFKGVNSLSSLIDVYHQLRKEFKFESDLTDPKADTVSGYANEFLETILIDAQRKLSFDDVILIVDFIKNLDVYTAIKSIESLLYSHSDLVLLQIAKQQNWAVHFDHVAIRCGSSENDSAKKIASLLIKEYGYSHPQITTEKFYLFEEGWSAYPLYKMLSNGQVLRIFVDQSESTHPHQIIQHWNQVYGFTAHHLALRLSKIELGKRIAIPLPDIITLMTNKGREVLSPTGYYTEGLLSQVFTKPVKNSNIPISLIDEKQQLFKNLPEMLMNAKLLEIVSRREMSSTLAKQYFELYDIEFNFNDALHSAVYYQYFLPAQAAHVIKSSIET